MQLAKIEQHPNRIRTATKLQSYFPCGKLISWKIKHDRSGRLDGGRFFISTDYSKEGNHT